MVSMRNIRLSHGELASTVRCQITDITGGSPMIAFLGLGLMGMPMASRLLAAGYPLVVWTARRSGPKRRLPPDTI